MTKIVNTFLTLNFTWFEFWDEEIFRFHSHLAILFLSNYPISDGMESQIYFAQNSLQQRHDQFHGKKLLQYKWWSVQKSTLRHMVQARARGVRPIHSMATCCFRNGNTEEHIFIFIREAYFGSRWPQLPCIQAIYKQSKSHCLIWSRWSDYQHNRRTFFSFSTSVYIVIIFIFNHSYKKFLSNKKNQIILLQYPHRLCNELFPNRTFSVWFGSVRKK